MAVNQWYDSERVEFLIYVHHKYSTKKIAEILGRTESAIRAEASRLGISLRKWKWKSMYGLESQLQ